MRILKKLLPFVSIIIFLVLTLFFSLTGTVEQSTNMLNSTMAPKNRNTVKLESDQSFSSATDSTIEYTVYIKNDGKSVMTYEISAWSSNGYSVEVWRENDLIGNGDQQLIPAEDSTITMGADEIATLVVRIIIPSDVPDQTVDTTVIRAENIEAEISDFVTLTSTADLNLHFPSNWVQLGSDPNFPVSPKGIDIKSLYYSNNGTHVFFRMAMAEKPNPKAFLYSVYFDTRAGGEEIDNFNYDYSLSSEGILYEWNGVNWINSDYLTQWQIEGTSIILGVGIDALEMTSQEIHLLACTVTKDWVLKDKLGHFNILKDSIAEIPLILIPILGIAIFTFHFSVSTRNKHKK